MPTGTGESARRPIPQRRTDTVRGAPESSPRNPLPGCERGAQCVQSPPPWRGACMRSTGFRDGLSGRPPAMCRRDRMLIRGRAAELFHDGAQLFVTDCGAGGCGAGRLLRGCRRQPRRPDLAHDNHAVPTAATTRSPGVIGWFGFPPRPRPAQHRHLRHCRSSSRRWRVWAPSPAERP